MGTGFMEDLESFGKGFALPKRFGQAFTARRLPYRVEIDVVLEGDRFVCETLKAERKKGGPPVTSEGVRRIPVQDLIRTAALQFIHRVKENPRAKGEVIISPGIGSFKRLALAGPTDEALEHVALVYRLAYACNEAPTKAVIEAFGLSQSTGERWVSKAREKGLLGMPKGRRD